MKTKIITLLVFTFIRLTNIMVYGTHIFNAELNTMIIKATNDSIRFNVSIRIRSSCILPLDLPEKIWVCIYDDNSGARLNSTEVQNIQINYINNCLGYCVREYFYSENITVSKTSMYLFQSELCCRKSLNNIRNDQLDNPFIGSTIYVRQSGDVNLSYPQIKLPYIHNINSNRLDSIKYIINNQDADSVSITAVAPFYGGSNTITFPECSDSSKLVEIAPSDYASGYSYLFPLGSNGQFNIDVSKSIIYLKKSYLLGDYVTAIRFAFFKKGVLYYETIREIQVVVSNYVLNEYNQIKLSAQAIPIPYSELKWSVCPTNVNQFELERSDSNSRSFRVIAILGPDNTEYIDQTVEYGKNYNYRLKLLMSFKTIYSNEVKVTFFNQSVSDIENINITVSPNPFNDAIDIIAEMPLHSVTIYSINGQKLIDKTFESNTVKINVADLAVGFYIAECATVDGRVKRIKIQKH